MRLRPFLAVCAGTAAFIAALPPCPAGPHPLSEAAREGVDRARTKVVVLKVARPGKQGSGTGFLARPNLVITAGHVITGASGVTAWVNGVPFAAGVLESHPQHDLALLRLRARSLSLKPMPLAPDSSQLAGAEELLILAGPSQGPQADGEPRSRLPIPAAFSRRLPLTDPTGRRNEMLSMHATVRRGDSGSPVLRVRDGQVVGVLSSREYPDAAGASRFAYAVPVEAVHAWMDAALQREQDGEFYLLRHR